MCLHTNIMCVMIILTRKVIILTLFKVIKDKTSCLKSIYTYINDQFYEFRISRLQHIFTIKNKSSI